MPTWFELLGDGCQVGPIDLAEKIRAGLDHFFATCLAEEMWHAFSHLTTGLQSRSNLDFAMTAQLS